MKEIEKILKVVANEKRLLIIKNLIKEKRLTVSEISERINLSFKATSKHLSLLYQADFVGAKKVSNNVLYFLTQPDHLLKKEILKLINKLEDKYKQA